MKFSCIKLKRSKENVVYVNIGRVITTMSMQKSSLTMEETFPDKGILEKLTREKKNLAFYIAINKDETFKQAITLKHLIAYNNLKMYINPKSVH